jgi:hypothetical protein
MLSGFNTNFRYRGVLFHVQTEDSGRENPHVITHLFHGGNIIASTKQDYRELLNGSDIEVAVKKMMETQHKTILKQLSRGEHDRAIGERLGPDIFKVAAGNPKSAEGTDTDSSAPPTVTEEQRSAAPPASRSVSPAMAEPTMIGSETVLPPEPPEPSTPLSRVFGERVVSEKPLDEVVLDYLVENARKRKRQPK